MILSRIFASYRFHGFLHYHQLASPLLVLPSLLLHPHFPLQTPHSTVSSLAGAFSGDSSAQGIKPSISRSKPRSLSSIFVKPTPKLVSRVEEPCTSNVKPKKVKKWVPLLNSLSYQPMEEKEFPKELSPEMTGLVSRLQEEDYLKEANYTREAPLDAKEVPVTLYSRHFLKSAAEKFGQDRQEIAKWSSGSDLKKVALFGCPSVERKTVFAAKRLRAFFKIQEDVICRGCKMKSSCKFVNQRVGRVEKVILPDTMRILTLLALDAIPRQLSIPRDLKSSVCKLLKEVLNLSA